MQKSKISVQDICSIAIMTAITVVMAQISIPMPMGVPMTMQTFAITLAGVILGSKKGGLSIFRWGSEFDRTYRRIYYFISNYGLCHWSWC